MATDDEKLIKIEQKYQKLKKEEADIKRKKLAKEKESQKRRELIVGQMIFEKSSKGSIEHQAILVAFIESLENKRLQDLFAATSESLGLTSGSDDRVTGSTSEPDELNGSASESAATETEKEELDINALEVNSTPLGSEEI